MSLEVGVRDFCSQGVDNFQKMVKMAGIPCTEGLVESVRTYLRIGWVMVEVEAHDPDFAEQKAARYFSEEGLEQDVPQKGNCTGESSVIPTLSCDDCDICVQAFRETWHQLMQQQPAAA